jgi:16S rRNA (guanine527-N7)-methyltransferase
MNTPLIDEVGFKERFLAALGEQAPERADLLARHAWQVAVKNQVMNLTRIVDPKEMAIRHALDSLTAVPIFMNTEDFAVESALDLGTGAGWPGLALAIAIPHLNVTLLDARKKKIIFLEELVKDLGLSDRVTCVWSRFEDYIRPERKNFDVVLARAVGPIERILNWCTNNWFGHLLLWKGPGVEDELDDCHKLLKSRQMEIVLDIPYQLPDDEVERRLILLEGK